MKIFRNKKTHTLYLGANTYSNDQMLALERNGDNFSIKIVYTSFYDIKDINYAIIKDQLGNSFSTADECEVYLKKMIEGDDLKMFRYIGVGVNVKNFDFTLLEELSKESPSYVKGRKTKAQYKDLVEEDLVVEKVFTDIRDQNGTLKKLEVEFKWFNESGEVGVSKKQVVKKYNKYEAETEERLRRHRQFDYLKASVRGTVYESFINTLTNHYKNEIELYKEDGDIQLQQKMQQETDPTISAILSAEIPRNDEPSLNISVENSILYQMGLYELP